jgi:hypothetical protein
MPLDVRIASFFRQSEKEGGRRAKKNPPNFRKEGYLSFGTQSRSRTGTGVNPQVFETSASTNSAIWAFHKCDAKIVYKRPFGKAVGFFFEK